ncbi:glutamic acid-rich protein-like [Brassica napus]|uniref:glutamic acid-rich protein-like n=1 Tax=Brassica napus TaxID=3708 RepID=UPI000BBF39C0|nr:glutamic acid-rich protein-like [Brassica napus]XP_022558423.1 glutamic acid-rich protein-like [Brassica napus]XP_048615336.1 glutamic acid-rich protein-like [Brassica napus]
MSRCFPFPPPGYEKKKKIRTEEADSLIKEKQKKEKKHKKEKKDIETSKDRYKEGKERKEKHSDRKDREKRDKNAVGVLPNTVQNNGNEEVKFVQDLARRISNEEEEARESQSVGKSSFPCGVRENFAMDKRSENVVGRVSSWRDPKGTEIMVQPVGKKELQELNHLKESVTKGDNKSLDSEEIKKSEPKYTTHSSSQENTEHKHKYVEGGSMLKERDVDNRNIGKRKDHERNGFLYENGSRLNKIHRPVASPVSSVENGRNLGAYQTPPKLVTELQETVCNPEVNEHRVNGFIDSQEHKSLSSVEVKENGEASAKKRPHSDLKYLDQILSVPKREELHEFDGNEEQEWLFGQSGVSLSKRPKTDSTTSLDETLQVWSQALRIESTDTVALPYVVPF